MYQAFHKIISEIDIYKIDSDISINKHLASQTVPKGYTIRINKELYTIKNEDLVKLGNSGQIIVKAKDGSFLTINSDEKQNFSLSSDTSVLSKSIKPQADLIDFINKRPDVSAGAIAILAIYLTLVVLMIAALVCSIYISISNYINKKN